VDRYAALKEEGLKEERVLLLEGWKEVEAAHAEAGGDPQSVTEKMPRKIKMRRMAAGSEGAGGEAVWEEYYDYHFPDDKKEIGECHVCHACTPPLICPYLPTYNTLNIISCRVCLAVRVPSSAGIKILENAMKWKKMLEGGGAGAAVVGDGGTKRKAEGLDES
jgi:hypothetical protein